MKLRMIGALVEGKFVHGFRIIDEDNIQMGYRDVPMKSVAEVISSGKATIEGLAIDDNKKILVGTNGQIKRYPLIEGGKVVAKDKKTEADRPPIIILSQYEEDYEVIGYKVCNWEGKVFNISKEDIIAYGKVNGIANGALRNINNGDGDSNYIIASIRGSYERINVRTNKRIEVEEEIDPSIKINYIPWSLGDFQKYMDGYGFSYNVIYRDDSAIDYELSGIPSTMKVLKLPEGLRTFSQSMFDSNSSEVRVIILPKSIKEISILEDNFPDLKKIVLTHGMKEINYIYVNKNNALEINLPETLEKIEDFNVRYKTGKADIDMSKTNIKSISSSFSELQNNVTVKFSSGLRDITNSFLSYGFNGVIDLSNTELESIGNSFHNSQIKGVIFPETLKQINGSFGRTNIRSIDLPAGLTQMSESFAYTEINEVDLTKCTKLTRVDSGNFAGCRSLSKVTLGDNIEKIESRAFAGCTKLKEINLDRVKYIGYLGLRGYELKELRLTPGMRLCGANFTDNITLFVSKPPYSVVMENYLNEVMGKAIIEEGIEQINKTQINGTRLSYIKLPDSLKNIPAFCFINALTKEVDFGSGIEGIGISAFEDSEIEIAILNDGLKKIEDNAFKKCSKLKVIYIPKTVEEIGKSVFRGTKNNIGLKAYVHKGTIGHAYCKRNNIRCILVENREDVYKLENMSNEVSETKKSKLNMLLSMDKQTSELLDDKYKDNAAELYKIHSILENRGGSTLGNIEDLDTSKFIQANIETVKLIDYGNFKENRDKHASNGEAYDENNISKQFIGMCNFITRNTNLNVAYLTDKAHEVLNSDNCEISSNFEYIDNFCTIIRIGLAHKVMSDDENDRNKQSVIFVITMGNYVRYATCVDAYSLFRLERRAETRGSSGLLSDVLKAGDVLDLEGYYAGRMITPVGNMEMPKFIQNEIVKAFNEQVRVLDILEEVKLASGRSRRRYKPGGTIKCRGKLVILNNLSGEISISEAVYTKVKKDTTSVGSSEEFDITIHQIAMGDKIGTDDEKRYLKNIFADTYTTKMAMFYNLGEEYVDKYKELDGAYDTEECYEVKLSKYLRSYNVTEIDRLCGDDAKIILESDFFRQFKLTQKEMSKAYTQIGSIDIEDGLYTIIEMQAYSTELYEVFDEKYALCIINNSEKIKNTRTWYVSDLKFKEVFELILKMGVYEDGDKCYDKLVDDVVDIKDFQIINIWDRGRTDRLSGGTIFRNLIGINKVSGQIFLIGGINDESTGGSDRYYLLFRMKTIEGAIAVHRILNNTYSYYWDYRNIILAIDKEDGLYTKKGLVGLRKYIMSGAPNNIDVYGYGRIYELVAKQRAE